MEVTIRGVRDDDHEAVHAILTSRHVLEGSMRVPHFPLHHTRERLAPRPGLHQIVAVADGRVVGFGELVTEPAEPRGSHMGDINLVAVEEAHGGRGIGRRLTEELVELGFGWLNLQRIGLIVFDGNDRAIRLYESLGFEHEGTLRRFNYTGGRYLDAHVMARLR